MLNLHKYYQFVKHDMTNDCLFFELKSECPKFSCSPIVCGGIYAPPSQSPYANTKIFEEIEEAMLYWNDEKTMYMYFGDNNSRTGLLNDFISESDENGYVPMCDIIDDLEIVNVRYSQDLFVNSFGKDFIDFCVRQSLLIANGRLGEDKGVGKFTCKDASVVDYLVTSPLLFKEIENFEVDAFDHILSDVHCPIIFSLNDGKTKVAKTGPDCVGNQDRASSSKNYKPIWKPDSKDQFINEVNSFSIDEILEQLNSINDNQAH